MIFLRKVKFSTLLLLLFFSIDLFSQIDLTMPINRMVYQRNKQNTATIYVAGSFSGQFEKIEARLTTLDGAGNAKSPIEQTAWATIVTNPTKSNFLAQMPNIKGGWYLLEVRAIQFGEQIGNFSTVKVGVGEVFSIAGQSNAQGEKADRQDYYYGAKDDRVNCINVFDMNSTGTLKYPVISHLESASFLAPAGKNSHCWGPLGDLITKNWDVPVIFFNAAVGGSGIFQWRAGATYTTAEIDNSQFRFDFTKGEPYIHLEKTLKYYNSLMGIRAVLWHQGETDTGIFLENSGNTAEIYRDNLRQVIQISRNQTDKDISWMVAKASLLSTNGTFGQTVTSQRVISGQQMTIDLPNFNVFNGPDTDFIQPSAAERDNGVHFWGQGLLDLANAWYSKINTANFINNSKPQSAATPEIANLSNCVNDNQITAQLPAGFTNYQWFADDYVTNSKNQSFTATNAKVLVPYMKDASGKNFVPSPPINFTPAKLTITTDKPTTLCEGQTLNIIANTFNNNYNWSNGITNKSIPIKESGTYTFSVNSKDVYGCVAKANGNFLVTVNPLPATPKIIADSSPSICEGTAVTLRPDASIGNLDPVWSNQTYNTAVSISKSGTYSLILKDNKNCESLPSNAIEVKVNPNPLRPDIVAGGSTTFCADKFVLVGTTQGAGYQWFRNNTLVPDLKTVLVNLSESGIYNVKILNEFGCTSPASNDLLITTWALPEAPIITKNGKAEFCGGNSVELTASSSLQNLVWKTSEKDVFSTNPKITINSVSDSKMNSNTTYFATVTDDRGCTSLPSEKTLVAVRANPTTPFIDAVGTYTLEAKAPILGLDGTSYDWYFTDKVLSLKEKAVKVNQAGNYTVKAKIAYTLPNGNKLECFSGISKVFDFYVDPAGIFSVYPNPSVDGIFTIETKDDLQNVKFDLITALGQKILSTGVDLFNNRKTINLSNLPGGEYKLRLKAGNIIETKSLIIIR